MTIQTKISFKEYVKLLYTLTYKKPLMKLLLVVNLASLVWIIGFYTDILPVPKPTYYQFLTVALITVIQPLFIFLTIRKNYQSSCHLKDPLEIEFTQTVIKVKGEFYHNEIGWVKMYEVVELRNWFMVYQNNLSAIIIPKKSFSPDEEKEFKALLRSISSVPIHLKQ